MNTSFTTKQTNLNTSINFQNGSCIIDDARQLNNMIQNGKKDDLFDSLSNPNNVDSLMGPKSPKKYAQSYICICDEDFSYFVGTKQQIHDWITSNQYEECPLTIYELTSPEPLSINIKVERKVVLDF